MQSDEQAEGGECGQFLNIIVTYYIHEMLSLAFFRLNSLGLNMLNG